MCRFLFAALCDRRDRSRLMDRKIDRLLTLTLRQEKTMSDILDRLEALKTQVAEHTTAEGNKLAEAVAAARKAQQAEDQESARAELEAALAKIDEISKGLIEFSPSGN